KLKGFPTTSDPCGEVLFGRRDSNNENVIVSKVDYSQSQKHTLFGRWEHARLITPNNFDGVNLLSASTADYKQTVQSLVFGDTYLIGANSVNSFRATLLRTVNDKSTRDYFSFSDIGVKGVYLPLGFPKIALINISGGFSTY